MESLKLENTSAKFLSEQPFRSTPEQGLPYSPHDAMSGARLVAGPAAATENGWVASSKHGCLLGSLLALYAQQALAERTVGSHTVVRNNRNAHMLFTGFPPW